LQLWTRTRFEPYTSPLRWSIRIQPGVVLLPMFQKLQSVIVQSSNLSQRMAGPLEKANVQLWTDACDRCDNQSIATLIRWSLPQKYKSLNWTPTVCPNVVLP